MDNRPVFRMELSEDFPHLDHAPIVEAVIHWRARGEANLEPEKLRSQLAGKLPDYPAVKSQQELHLESKIDAQSAAHSQRTEWRGLRLESTNGRNIAQFMRDGFAFSRLAPYENWDRFATEAIRLWRIHAEFARPLEVERLGVRFINRIAPIDLGRLEDVLTSPPQHPGELALPVREFLHRTDFETPGTSYNVAVIQTTQPPAPPDNALALILDIDVSARESIELDDAASHERLNEMRWLKNKAFFGSLHEHAIQRFREDRT